MMKLKGTLKLERRVVRILLCTTLVALMLGAALEYILPGCLPQTELENWHTDFLTNVCLGVAGSASISMVCLLFPYLSKKKEQETRIVKGIEKLFCRYEYLYKAIAYGGGKDRADQSYSPETTLLWAARNLMAGADQFLEEYTACELSCENMERIAGAVDSIFYPVAQTTEKFVKMIVPQEHIAKSDGILGAGEQKHFDGEENSAIYGHLLSALEEIGPRTKVEKIFSGYVVPEGAMVLHYTAALREGTTLLHNNSVQLNLRSIQERMGIGIIQELEKQHKKRRENGRERLGISQRLNELHRQMDSYPEDKKEEFYRASSKIYAELEKNELDAAKELLRELEKRLEKTEA